MPAFGLVSPKFPAKGRTPGAQPQTLTGLSTKTFGENQCPKFRTSGACFAFDKCFLIRYSSWNAEYFSKALSLLKPWRLWLALASLSALIVNALEMAVPLKVRSVINETFGCSKGANHAGFGGQSNNAILNAIEIDAELLGLFFFFVF